VLRNLIVRGIFAISCVVSVVENPKRCSQIVSKLLSLLTFLFIFDHLSYSKNLKNYHIFYYNLFY
jgi:hypothetical protein